MQELDAQGAGASRARGELHMKTQSKIKLSDLHLNDRNPRTISKKAFTKLCESIKQFPKMMEVRGIVVDEQGIVIGGTQRYRACAANGMKEVPTSWILRAEDFTEQERKRFIIADNAPGGMVGIWDMDLLANEWDIGELIIAGFDEEELTGLIVPDDNKAIDEDDMADTKNECPKCGYKWQV